MKKAAPLDRAGALTRYIDERCNKRHRKKLQLLVSMGPMVEHPHLGGGAVVPDGLAEEAGVSVTIARGIGTGGHICDCNPSFAHAREILHRTSSGPVS